MHFHQAGFALKNTYCNRVWLVSRHPYNFRDWSLSKPKVPTHGNILYPTHTDGNSYLASLQCNFLAKADPTLQRSSYLAHLQQPNPTRAMRPSLFVDSWNLFCSVKRKMQISVHEKETSVTLHVHSPSFSVWPARFYVPFFVTLLQKIFSDGLQIHQRHPNPNGTLANNRRRCEHTQDSRLCRCLKVSIF